MAESTVPEALAQLELKLDGVGPRCPLGYPAPAPAWDERTDGAARDESPRDGGMSGHQRAEGLPPHQQDESAGFQCHQRLDGSAVVTSTTGCSDKNSNSMYRAHSAPAIEMTTGSVEASAWVRTHLAAQLPLEGVLVFPTPPPRMLPMRTRPEARSGHHIGPGGKLQR
jgi:hypothetical protein